MRFTSYGRIQTYQEELERSQTLEKGSVHWIHYDLLVEGKGADSENKPKE